jgi:hypothetical protein
LGDYQFLGLVAVFLGCLAICSLLLWQRPDFAPDWLYVPPEAKDVLTIGVGLLAVAGTLASWVYQSANRRIGVVDLFACEVSSLCKVALVTNFAENSVKRHQQLGTIAKLTPAQLDSRESYTPIYDKSASDLQSLEREAVTSVTAFYTYRRTVMDYLRAALAADSGAAAQAVYEQMIYMLFLMLESARQAVEELTEFQPERDETLVTVYCSELPLFAFLLDRHRGIPEADFKYQRLILRIRGYDDAVADLVYRIETVDLSKLKKGPAWETWQKAQTTCVELRNRYGRLWQASQPDFPRPMPEKLRRKSDPPYAGKLAAAQ